MDSDTTVLEKSAGMPLPPLVQGDREEKRAPFPSAARLANWEKKFPPLEQENREVVPTACAAHHLNRRPQTLRAWACLENGPMLPVRIHGRLGWKTADLRRLLGVTQ